jgi:hypothetical protein
LRRARGGRNFSGVISQRDDFDFHSPQKFHGYSVANFLGEQIPNFFAAIFSARRSPPMLSKKSDCVNPSARD